MNQIFLTLYLLLLLFLRIAIPIAVTFSLGWMLKKLDARWRKEAEEFQKIENLSSRRVTTPCWVANECSEDARKECRAFVNPLIPCWNLFRATDGSLSTNCQKCQYREQAFSSTSVVMSPGASQLRKTS